MNLSNIESIVNVVNYVLVTVLGFAGILLSFFFIAFNVFSENEERKFKTEKLLKLINLFLFITVLLLWASSLIGGSAGAAYGFIMFSVMAGGWFFVFVACIAAKIYLRIRKDAFWKITSASIGKVMGDAAIGALLCRLMAGLVR